ncbi:MAG: hypothetical protein U0R24_04150 [Solirubrobacterales bacterium]
MPHPSHSHPASLADLAAEAEALATDVAVASHLHGPKHWRAVARTGAVILNHAPHAHARSVFVFAAVHDTQRLNDGFDPDHGKRAAAVLESELDHGLGDSQLDRVLYALRHHSGGTGPERHDDPTIGACWDSDRLTLDRVRIVPDETYISTPPVREDLQRFRAIARRISEGEDVPWIEVAEEY